MGIWLQEISWKHPVSVCLVTDSVDEASVRMTSVSAVLLSSHRQFTRKPLKIPASSYEDISELSKAALLISRVKQAALPEQARVNSSVTCSVYFGEPSPRSMRS